MQDNDLIFESYRKSKRLAKSINDQIDANLEGVCFSKEDAIKLLEFIEKHSNEYDVIADSTAYNLKQLVIEKFK
jgi:uncharacterized protein Smg (DUF494 family)